MDKDPDSPKFSLSPEDAEAIDSQLEGMDNFPLGALAGFTAALVGAALWAVITVSTNMQIAIMAIGVGFMVSFAIRFAGNGSAAKYAYLGAALSLFSCLLGNVLTIMGFLAKSYGVGFFEVARKIKYSSMPERLAQSFSPVDLIFYGLAIYAGYTYSARR